MNNLKQQSKMSKWILKADYSFSLLWQIFVHIVETRGR